jgi:RNA polymerase sigma-70 factor (ECF subfamily)
MSWNKLSIELSNICCKDFVLTDDLLINNTIKGDDNAFKELVKRYEPLVASTVIGMLGKCPEADDVGQETFIRFYRSLQAFRGEASVGTYLTRIAINLSLNELKRRRRRLLLFPKVSFEIQGPDDECKDFERKDLNEMIKKAIQHLEPKFRTVIVLRLLDGFSTKETGEILGIPNGTVLSRLARAQAKLLKLLTTYLGEENE